MGAISECGIRESQEDSFLVCNDLIQAFQDLPLSIPCTPRDVVVVLEKAIRTLDDDFCRICVEKGREWESGTTALVAAVVNDHLVIANLGDCRAVMCWSVEMDCLDDELEQRLQSDGWRQDEDNYLRGKWERAIGNDTGRNLSRWCFWKYLHSVAS